LNGEVNDVLIVIGAAKLDADLVTENAEDMERWRRMLRGRMKHSRILGVKRQDHGN